MNNVLISIRSWGSWLKKKIAKKLATHSFSKKKVGKTENKKNLAKKLATKKKPKKRIGKTKKKKNTKIG